MSVGDRDGDGRAGRVIEIVLVGKPGPGVGGPSHTVGIDLPFVQSL